MQSGQNRFAITMAVSDQFRQKKSRPKRLQRVVKARFQVLAALSINQPFKLGARRGGLPLEIHRSVSLDELIATALNFLDAFLVGFSEAFDIIAEVRQFYAYSMRNSPPPHGKHIFLQGQVVERENRKARALEYFPLV